MKENKNYTGLVSSIFHKSENKSVELSLRKDVANKWILRGFKKYIIKLFNSKRIRPCRLNLKYEAYKNTLILEAKNLRIIDSEINGVNKNFEEFVCWMAMSKNTLRTKSLFDYENESIVLMDEILTKYSHKKLESLYKNQNIASVYEYFIKNGLEEFMMKFPQNKKWIYLDYALEMLEKFREFN